MEGSRSWLSSPFGNLFESLLLCGNEPAHVSLQKKPERRFPLQNVTHERAAVAGMELVDMAQTLEDAVHHLVDEAARPVDFHDFGGEALADSEMSPFEGDQIAELQHAGQSSRLDDAFTRERCTLGVRADVECQIEADVGRRGNQRFNDDAGQMDFSARILIARSHIRRMMSLPGRITRQYLEKRRRAS